MKKMFASTVLALALIPMSNVFAGDAWVCHAAECTADLITIDGTVVSIIVERGNELHRGLGMTVVLTSGGWKAQP